MTSSPGIEKYSRSLRRRSTLRSAVRPTCGAARTATASVGIRRARARELVVAMRRATLSPLGPPDDRPRRADGVDLARRGGPEAVEDGRGLGDGLHGPPEAVPAQHGAVVGRRRV